MRHFFASRCARHARSRSPYRAFHRAYAALFAHFFAVRLFLTALRTNLYNQLALRASARSPHPQPPPAAPTRSHCLCQSTLVEHPHILNVHRATSSDIARIVASPRYRPRSSTVLKIWPPCRCRAFQHAPTTQLSLQAVFRVRYLVARNPPIPPPLPLVSASVLPVPHAHRTKLICSRNRLSQALRSDRLVTLYVQMPTPLLRFQDLVLLLRHRHRRRLRASALHDIG